MPEHQITFPGTQYPPIMLEKSTPLADYLTVQNSPILFGCRTGICGTCLVEVKGRILCPSPDEQELLDTLAPGNPLARLACQCNLTADLEIRRWQDPA